MNITALPGFRSCVRALTVLIALQLMFTLVGLFGPDGFSLPQVAQALVSLTLNVLLIAGFMRMLRGDAPRGLRMAGVVCAVRFACLCVLLFAGILSALLLAFSALAGGERAPLLWRVLELLLVTLAPYAVMAVYFRQIAATARSVRAGTYKLSRGPEIWALILARAALAAPALGFALRLFDGFLPMPDAAAKGESLLRAAASLRGENDGFLQRVCLYASFALLAARGLAAHRILKTLRINVPVME